MMNINKINLELNNNNLALNSTIKTSNTSALPSAWCNVIRVKNSYDLSEKYQNICQIHHNDNKWILMINPENDSLEQLSMMGKINPEKILKVNVNKVNINLEHIKNTLLKGNCSAIILSNAHYNNAQLKEISRSAALGKTQCIILQKRHIPQPSQLH
tara:strand:- start:9994 stop:10464 length:471 start_codon:yes stop_codon:yes gene_type:complete